MKRTTIIVFGVTLVTLSACNRPSAEEQRARDLALALQTINAQQPQFSGPNELGVPQQSNGQLSQNGAGGQWVYIPQGYVLQPAGQAPVQQAPVTRTVYRTASAGGTVRSAPARQPTRVTHTKRDAVIGAAAGGVAGAVIDRSVKGAVIGAAAGGILGAVVGSTVDVDRR